MAQLQLSLLVLCSPKLLVRLELCIHSLLQVWVCSVLQMFHHEAHLEPYSDGQDLFHYSQRRPTRNAAVLFCVDEILKNSFALKNKNRILNK
ncbi:hypothetical protein ACJW30_06G142400 [Castanea mollissima]